MEKSALFRIVPLLSLTIVVMMSNVDLLAQEQKSKEWKYNGEVFGSSGIGRFYHGDHYLGGGLDLGAGIGIRPFSGVFRALGFEAGFNGIGFSNEWGNGYSYKGCMYALTGNGLYHFGRSRTQLYVFGGVGVLKANYTHVNPYARIILNDPDNVYRDEGTKMVLNFGAGFKARIASRLSVRPEIRLFDTTIGTGYNWRHIRLSVGLGYHF